MYACMYVFTTVINLEAGNAITYIHAPCHCWLKFSVLHASVIIRSSTTAEIARDVGDVRSRSQSNQNTQQNTIQNSNSLSITPNDIPTHA